MRSTSVPRYHKTDTQFRGNNHRDLFRGPAGLVVSFATPEHTGREFRGLKQSLYLILLAVELQYRSSVCCFRHGREGWPIAPTTSLPGLPSLPSLIRALSPSDMYTLAFIVMRTLGRPCGPRSVGTAAIAACAWCFVSSSFTLAHGRRRKAASSFDQIECRDPKVEH